MAIGNKTRKLYTPDGIPVRFSKINFTTASKRWIEEYNKANDSFKGERMLIKKIAKELFHPNGGDISETELKTVENWVKGNNGPSDLSYIYDLARILEMEDKDAFMVHINNEEEKCVNTARAIENNISMSVQQREKEAAHELYSFLVEAIARFTEAEYATFIENDMDTPEWENAVKSHPKRFPILVEIKKQAIYLSKDIRDQVIKLVESMYDNYDPDWYELSPGAILDYNVERRYDLMSDILEIDKDNLYSMDFNRRCQVEKILDEEEEYHFKMLDDIFSDYLA